MLLARGRSVHTFDEAVGPHVGPISIYEFEASGAAVRFTDNGPAVGDLYKAWPKGILPFVIDQDMVDAVFVFKWISHVVLL